MWVDQADALQLVDTESKTCDGLDLPSGAEEGQDGEDPAMLVG